tara:strand:- start:211 stop:1062 length:852 start_codon:yes stop_codon:yes gene_type:complete
MSYEHIQPADLDYQYEFQPDEIDSIKDCVETHGFAVAKSLLSSDFVEELKSGVRETLDPEGDLTDGQSRVAHTYVEKTKTFWKLLADEKFLAISRAVTDSDELTLNRSAAILRDIGSSAVRWHTDFLGSSSKPESLGSALNSGEWPSGLWFYLTGAYPTHGGLAVIADSHLPDWEGPVGFEFTAGRRSFYKEGEKEDNCMDFDIPGLVPFFTDPGDFIIFAARTYHGAFPNTGPVQRISVGLNFRPRGPVNGDWPLSETAQAFMNDAPAHMQPFLYHYTGLDH